MDVLPTELWRDIFLHLSPRALFAILPLVSRSWRAIAAEVVGSDAPTFALSLAIKRIDANGGALNGTFIDVTERPRLFERFERADGVMVVGHVAADVDPAIWDSKDWDVDVDADVTSALVSAVASTLSGHPLAIRLSLRCLAIANFRLSKLPDSAFLRAVDFIRTSRPRRIDMGFDFADRFTELKCPPIPSVLALGQLDKFPLVLNSIGGTSLPDLLAHFPSVHALDLNGLWGDWRYFFRVFTALQSSSTCADRITVLQYTDHDVPPFKPLLLPRFFPALVEMGTIRLDASLPALLNHQRHVFDTVYATVKVLRIHLVVWADAVEVLGQAVGKLARTFPSVRRIYAMVEATEGRGISDEVAVGAVATLVRELPARDFAVSVKGECGSGVAKEMRKECERVGKACVVEEGGGED